MLKLEFVTKWQNLFHSPSILLHTSAIGTYPVLFCYRDILFCYNIVLNMHNVIICYYYYINNYCTVLFCCIWSRVAKYNVKDDMYSRVYNYNLFHIYVCSILNDNMKDRSRLSLSIKKIYNNFDIDMPSFNIDMPSLNAGMVRKRTMLQTGRSHNTYQSLFRQISRCLN